MVYQALGTLECHREEERVRKQMLKGQQPIGFLCPDDVLFLLEGTPDLQHS